MIEEKKIFSVSDLTLSIKKQIEPFFRNIYLQGEISNFKRQSSGHLYFNLKDKNAQISAVFFKGNTHTLERLPKDGDEVIVRGEISIYPPRGSYQIIVRELKYLGVGELLIKLHELKNKLQNKGWFDPEKKKPIPKFPKRIGVVTSPTGAVIQDILNVLTRRFFGINLLLYPVKVQGENSAKEIAQAIDNFNKHNLVDLMIIARGGGSLEDLWAFNEEIVAKSIFESTIPIISAIGHETDTSISDFVADIRAPTPSAAAEIAIKEKTVLQNTLNNFNNSITKALKTKIEHYKNYSQTLAQHPIFISSYHLLSKPIQQIDDIKESIKQSQIFFIERKKEKLEAIKKQTKLLSPLSILSQSRERLSSSWGKIEVYIKQNIKLYKDKCNPSQLQRELDTSIKNNFELKRERLKKIASHFNSLDPKNLLKKGYSILFSEKNNSIILSVNDIEENQKIYAKLHDGKVQLTTNKKIYEK
jgi:exodeoxyribonuclease VII large subunit